MKKGALLGGLSLSLLLLLLAVAACGKDLQPRVDELESQVSSLEAQKGRLESQVQSLGAEKTNLQGQVQSLQAEKADAESKLQDLEGAKAKLESRLSSLDAQRVELELAKEALEWDKTEAENANQNLEKQNQTLKDIAGPLPASLDNFFPPKAPAPVYLFEMFALEGPFGGIMVDLQQQDIAGVQANYDAFKAQYEKLAGMVPEWSDRFPMEPVEALGQALASGDPAQVGPAMGQVGQVCGSCHLLFQVKAHQKYHWPDFDEIEVADPLTNQPLSLHDYMLALSGAFGGIGNDLQQGQVDNARQDFQAFSARFKALPTNACIKCHTTPRTYFVDASVQGMVDQLGEALAATPPDAQAVEQLSGAIGNESCMKCHLVHLPAANTKSRWEAFADLFK